MKKAKLGTKIAIGFCLLIFIAVLLGGVAVWRMKGVVDGACKLAKEYVPEVKVSNEIERSSLMTMYNMVGYAWSQRDDYLKSARENLEQVKAFLTEARQLAGDSIHLVKLKAQVEQVAAGVKEYEDLANQTVAENQGIVKNRKMLDAAAARYMKNCADFLQSQNESMAAEIKANLAADKLAERLRKITMVNEIIGLGNDTRVKNFKSQALGDPALIEAAQKNFAAMDKKFEELRTITKKEVNLKQIDEIKAAAGEYEKAMSNLLANWLALREIGNKRGVVAEKVLAAARDTAIAGIDQTSAIAHDAESDLNTASTIMIFGLCAALVLGLFLAYFITRSITRPVGRIIETLDAGSGQVAAAAGQVASSSQALAEGSSEQAASLEETSSSMEEMASVTKANADNAHEADSLMAKTKNTVNQAGKGMNEMAESMNKISESGKEIGKIVKSIDEIAFQTNLLALNAAVEAARAGEAGMGFAVVADEVRNLAMRAAEAAKNTQSLIEDTVNRINQGSELVHKTQTDFNEVAASAEKVAALVSEIATASTEQSRGIEEVNQAISQMDGVVQRSAANAEEGASASEELSAQAAQMKEAVDDLVGLVKGGAMQNGHKPEKISRPAKQSTAALSHQSKTVPRLGAGPKGKEVKPAEIIPFNDTEALSEF